MPDDPSADFGFQRVPRDDKARRVRGVFDSVAGNYDLMNDLMSAGTHRLWKRFTLALANLRPGQRALDVAGGSGDLAAGMARQVGSRGLVVLTRHQRRDARARPRPADRRGIRRQRSPTCRPMPSGCPSPDSTFDCVTIGFGLRNVTDKTRRARLHASRAQARRAAAGAGVLAAAAPALKPLYDAYSFRVLPLLGKVVAGDEASYRYLAESIRMHPDQETLLRMMQEAGLEGCRYHNLSGGIVAVHRGYKY